MIKEQKYYLVVEYEPTQRNTFIPSFKIISEKNLKHFKLDVDGIKLYELVSPNPLDKEEALAIL
jgi:hypothetical protein